MKKIKQKQDPLKFFDKNVLMLSFDLDFRIISCNDTFEIVTGFSLAIIEGKHIFLDVFKKLPVYTIDDISYTISQGKIWQGNLRLPHPVNETSWYSGQIIPTNNEDGERIGYSVVAAVGSSQSDMISANNSSENWLKAIFNDPEEANILINTDGNIIEYNSAAFQFAEWCANKTLALEHSIFDYFDPKFSKTLEALMDKAGKGFRQKFCRNFKNVSGYIKTFDIELRPVFSSDMNAMGFVMVLVDITAEVALSKRIKNSEKRLDDIAFINAHEVRAPLASIMGLLHLLDYEDVNENGKQILDRLKKASLELEKIIHKVSETSYIETENVEKKKD
jgi:PAS domain S-box-containing protein